MDQKELREQENRCIQDQAPACTATCPAHVDMRSLAAEIARGDFAAALKIYRKAIPFPGIVSHICEQPCQTTCLRKDLGGSIEMAALERACLEFGNGNPEALRLLPRKSKTVAIVGAGLSGLTAAHDLARKGWGVTLFEASEKIGGGLWQTPAGLLPRDVLLNDLKVIDSLGIELRLNSPLGGDGISLLRLCEEYDAVFLGAGPQSLENLRKLSEDVPALTLNALGQLQVDPLTFQTGCEKVFAAGGVLRAQAQIIESHGSAVQSISEGHRAGTTIDRFLQKVSLTASRKDEGAYVTRLYTNPSEIPAAGCLIATDLTTNYSLEAAKAEAARSIQCECLECVKNCEYLKQYKGYPRKYIREIYNNLSIVMGTRHSNNFINSCALCGLCAEICPADVDMGLVCQDARQQMVGQKRMPASAHEFALKDMAFSNLSGGKFAMAKNAPGTETSAFAFFPGCQLSGSSPDDVEKAYAFLGSAFPGEGVGLMLRCCGAPADWAGNKELFSSSQQDFRAEYEKLGKPKIILACSSCYQVFQKYYPDVQIESFWDIYDRLGPQEIKPNGLHSAVVTVHDPCSTRHEAQIQDSVRSILRKAGCQVQELALSREKTECCSYGGQMWLANRALSDKVIERRIHESELDYVTYCAMCRDLFARHGKRTLHLFDIIFRDSLSTPGGDPALAPAVGYSQRHENRARLKEKNLKNIWSESMPEQADFEKIHLILPADVQKMVDERLILVEDMQKVIEYAERTSKRMFNGSTGHYLAYYKPTSVTYWVEYTPDSQANGFVVHRAYSHRMEIGMGAKK